ncbi:hypothetical protein HanIR_Chr14g0708291 [Helianthus annuus]|nr:hypothetical protein HanIR_Chr14g0708291 [Helianthus annuus]
MPDDNSSVNQTNNDDLTIQIANLIKNGFDSQNQNTKQNLSDSLKISLKLNSQNYALWARMIRVAIGGKSKTLLGHLSGKPSPPDPTDDGYERWEQDDLIVFSWLIQNIELAIASNLTEFPTTKSLWDALVVTYSSGKDKLQTFDLHVKANGIKQNGLPLEEFWIVMQGIWGEIDRRDPNPMTSPTDIFTYNKIRSEQKLFQFLNAIDRQHDPIKREILRWDPLPTAEGAYAAVRKETTHRNILGAVVTGSAQGVAAGLAATGSDSAEGAGLVSKGQRRSDFSQKSSSRSDKSHLKCSHCGMNKHTKEQCFQIVGYPEWWNDGHKKGNKTTGKDGGRAAAVVGNNNATSSDGGDGFAGFGGMASARAKKNEGEEGSGKGSWKLHPDPSSSKPQYFSHEYLDFLDPHVITKANTAQSCSKKQKPWIFDCGATDTMTFDFSDIVSHSKPKKPHIQNANGEISDVKGGGTIKISPTLKLSNCLYVPSLSHKLLSISHVTKELNCIVLMHPTFCILQDIRTGTIIGRGTERQGLYYVDEGGSTRYCDACSWHYKPGSMAMA